MALTSYLSPFIYPVFPREKYRTRIGIGLGEIARSAMVRKFTGTLTLRERLYLDGEQVGEGSEEIAVADGKPARDYVLREPELPRLGYIEFEVTADQPAFGRPMLEIGFASLSREGFGNVKVIDMPKFADPRIIDQIREIGHYCTTHTAAYVDSSDNVGDFFLVINPYEKALTVRLSTPRGRNKREVVKAHSARSLALADILQDGVPDTVLMTAPQRIIVYDSRAPLDDPDSPYSLDHLDPFRGEPVRVPVSFRRFARNKVRRAMFRLGLRRA
jgi:hypothetical protein